ncbi:MAG: hypothetical protein CMQ15_09455 [Gammaproteobacteria bacterium]|jgi:hypothetical protein|nr:hypothetical protein [Gammaproteobacteria bacterium]HJN94202.1 hypothetical protein [Gammaproteobacteria bacterium]|tara:strand:- start:8712 stop:9323 length:612 start_codon:yes stop_codon:yes gene_type:complete
MTQDFAKIRPEPLLERKPVEAPPAWSLMFTGILVGLTIGVFACVLFYLSGNVPPLNLGPAMQPAMASVVPEQMPEQEELSAADELELEFYHELANYEVSVDATPVELTAEQAGETLDNNAQLVEPLLVSYMLQTGAFEQQDLAYREMERQRFLGLDVSVKPEQLPGRVLFLIQSGPYTTPSQLNEVEQLLGRNNIPSSRLRLQ